MPDFMKLDKEKTYGTHIPTEEDRKNDLLLEEWQERRREEARQMFHRNPSSFFSSVPRN